MSRQKISEFRSKVIINSLLGSVYIGWTIKSDLVGIDGINGYDSYVVKVDQAVKKRFKNGLVKLDVAKEDIALAIINMSKKGYQFFIIEPYIAHKNRDERYISMQRAKGGVVISYTDHGGVNIEEMPTELKTATLNEDTIESIALGTGFSTEQLRKVRLAFDSLHISLLEINPYLFGQSGQVSVLDIAIEVDSAASHLVKEWGDADVRVVAKKHNDEEVFVRKMNEESSASFSLSTLNIDGSIFLLLSGGGASVVIADEIHNLGHGEQIANYGEYSGNPSRYETYIYTKQVLNLLLGSHSSKKLLFIGGAVANFTDIATTFSGVIDAIRERSVQLADAQVRVYVRRGGPREKIGLRNIETVLTEEGLLGGVYGPKTSIPDAVKELIKGLK